MSPRTFAAPTRLGVAAIALVVVLAACSAGSSSPTSNPGATSPSPAADSASPGQAGSPSAAAGGDAVTIQGFAFAPGTLTVSVGTSVTWTNQDSVGHTVTADDGSFDSKTLANGATFSQTFSKAGTYAYHCNIHKSMTATVVVQ